MSEGCNRDGLYVPNMRFGDSTLCTYCGARAQDMDHVIPRSQYDVTTRVTTDVTGIITPSCKPCNTKLGDTYFRSFAARCQYIQAHYIKKAQRYRKQSTWTDEELAQLDYTLMTHVAAGNRKMVELDRQTAWQDGWGFHQILKQINTHPVCDVSSPKYVGWVEAYFS